MSKELWDFIGVRRVASSESDIRVNKLIQTVFNTLETTFNINFKKYNNLQELITDKKRSNDELSYFWDWFDEIGSPNLLQILQTNLPDSEQLFDLLDYREMLLQLDKDNGIIDSYFISIVDTLYSIKEYGLSASEQAAVVEEDEFKPIFDKYREHKVLDQEKLKANQWIYSDTLAEKSRSFCYIGYKGRHKKWTMQYSKIIN